MFQWYRTRRARRKRQRNATTRIGSGRKIGLLIRSVLGLPKRVVLLFVSPIQSLLEAAGRGKRKVRDLLLGLPALLIALLVLSATVYAQRVRSQRELAYWSRLVRAVENNELSTAKLYVQRALNGGVVDRKEASFTLARLYMMSGATQRAASVLADLAPDNQAGYPPAHRLLAIIASDRFRATGNSEEIFRLQWHIEHADRVKSPEMYRAIGLYHAAKGEVDKAIAALLDAAESRPDVYFEIAELLVRNGRNVEAEEAVQKAEIAYRARFEREPDDEETRLRLATALFAQGKLPEAERLVKEKLAQRDDPKFRNLLSMIFVRFFDYQVVTGEPLENCYPLLQKAVETDWQNREALRRLLAIAKQQTELAGDVKEVLRKTIASGGASAMAHYVLGVIEWMDEEREKAKFHLEQAMELSPEWAVVANNLAYLEAASEDGDLAYAEELSSIAVFSEPDNAEFWDTRAVVREKRDNLKGAIADFQRALELSEDKDKSRFRSKLASAYRKFGQPEMAAAFEGS